MHLLGRDGPEEGAELVGANLLQGHLPVDLLQHFDGEHLLEHRGHGHQIVHGHCEGVGPDQQRHIGLGVIQGGAEAGK
jgi:hypothetical protein